MGVYIKGFPLPNNCGACPLRLAWCRERIYMVNRPDRCPLVSVPPHGDLVDRAEMREIAISLLDKAVTDQEANAIRKMWSRLGQMPVYIPPEKGE